VLKILMFPTASGQGDRIIAVSLSRGTVSGIAVSAESSAFRFIRIFSDYSRRDLNHAYDLSATAIRGIFSASI
jgi:hypothetical protein